MALFETGTYSGLSDLITKLDTFLTTSGAGNPGWTADHLATGSGQWAISKDDGSGQSVEVAFQWDTATPQYLGVYQYISGSGAGNYNTGNAPYLQVDDSGNGAQSTSNSTLAGSRRVLLSDDAGTYWCFTGDTYAHIVVEYTEGSCSHFGFGVLDKFNDWTGGEYCFGHRHQGTLNAGQAVSVGSTCLLDGLAQDGSSPQPSNMEDYVATVHAEGLPNAPTGAKWAVMMGAQDSANLGQDRQSTARDRYHFTGGFRANIVANCFGNFRNSTSGGFAPGYPMVVFYWDRVASPTQLYGPLGVMKDIRAVNMVNYALGDTFTIGGDTWYVFPTRKKGTGTEAGISLNQGIAYKQN